MPTPTSISAFTGLVVVLAFGGCNLNGEGPSSGIFGGWDFTKKFDLGGANRRVTEWLGTDSCSAQAPAKLTLIAARPKKSLTLDPAEDSFAQFAVNMLNGGTVTCDCSRIESEVETQVRCYHNQLTKTYKYESFNVVCPLGQHLKANFDGKKLVFGCVIR